MCVRNAGGEPVNQSNRLIADEGNPILCGEYAHPSVLRTTLVADCFTSAFAVPRLASFGMHCIFSRYLF